MQYSMGFCPTNSISIPLMKNIVAKKTERDHSEVTPRICERKTTEHYLPRQQKHFEAASYKKLIYERITTIYSKA